MPRIMLAPALLFLTACGATTPPPAVELRVQRVEVPVPVTCISKDRLSTLIAAEPAKIAGQLTGMAVHDLDVVSASAIRLRSYAGMLQAALKACAG